MPPPRHILKAYELQLKEDLSLTERASLLSPKGNTSRTEGFSNMRKEEVAIMKHLFETASLVAKEKLPFSKFGILVNNERRH